jgi:SOS response regulatory protein OraA/RecX
MKTQNIQDISQHIDSQWVTHKLIYRGHSYKLTQPRIDLIERARSRRESLIGYPLIYRGYTYELIPIQEPQKSPEKILRTLIYRGVSFEKAIAIA